MSMSKRPNFPINLVAKKEGHQCGVLALLFSLKPGSCVHATFWFH